MKRKSLWKALGAGMLALTLALSPAADLSAQAASVPAEQKTGDKTEGLASGDTAEIPVWGFTGTLDGATVYSVDVEWGAMTFQYADAAGSSNVWDPKTHSYSGGTTKQWHVYDGATKSIADSEQTAINQISVINHSNAAVRATFSYQPEGQYSTVTGQFTADAGTDFTTNVMRLDSADNNKGDLDGQGKEVTGKVYFMPSGSIAGAPGGSASPTWEQLGKITVAIAAGTP